MHEPVEKKIKYNSSGKGSLKLTNKTALSTGGRKNAYDSISCKLGHLPIMQFWFFLLFHKEELEEYFRGNLKGYVYQLAFDI